MNIDNSWMEHFETKGKKTDLHEGLLIHNMYLTCQTPLLVGERESQGPLQGCSLDLF